MDLAYLARVAAGNVDATAGAAPASAPVDRRPPPERAPMMPPSSSSALDRGVEGGLRYADGVASGGGDGSGAGAAGSGGFGRVRDVRDHRRASPSQSQWSSYPGAGPPLSGHGSWGGAEGVRGRDRGSSLGGAGAGELGRGGGEAGGRGAPPPGWRSRSPGDLSRHPYPPSLLSTPTRAPQLRESVSGGGGGGGGGGFGGAVGIEEMAAAPGSAGSGRGYHHGVPSRAALPSLSESSGGGGGVGGRYHEAAGPLPSAFSTPHGGRGGGGGGGGYGADGGATSPPVEERGAVGVGGLSPPFLRARDPHWPHPRAPSSAAADAADAAAEAAVAMTRLSPPPRVPWDLGSGVPSGGGGEEARARQSHEGGGGGLDALGLDRGRWPGASDDRGGYHPSRDFYGHDQRERDDVLSRGEYRPQSAQPQDQLHHRRPQQEQDPRSQQQLHSPFPSPPVLPRGDSDPGPYGGGAAAPAASRPLFSGMPGSMHPSYRPYALPGLADTMSSAGGQGAAAAAAAAAAGDRRLFTFGEVPGGSVSGGRGAAGAAAAEGARRR